MADGLCSGSDRKTFVASLINENVFKSSEKIEKCTKLATASSDECKTGQYECAETQKTGIKRDSKMTGTNHQQQTQQKLMDTKLSNKSASGASASVPAVGGLVAINNKSNNGRAVEQQHPKRKNVGLLATGGGNGGAVGPKQNPKRGPAVDLGTTDGNDPAQEGGGPDDTTSTKKKRCSDRYDSSESSDSGVATLSCTDSSTASSDASDPGSPYSPVSLGEDVHQSSKANMPPQIVPITQNHHHHQQQQQTTSTVQHQWPWNGSSNNTISNHNNNNINASNKNSSLNSVLSSGKNKRLSVNPSDTNVTAKKVRTSTSAERLPSGVSATNKRLKVQEDPQTKITGYFKSQMKPLKPIKQDISTLVARSTDKYFNVLTKIASSVQDEKDRKTIAIKKDFEIIDLPPLQTMPPSLKKIERKPAKVAQVAPISRKTAASQQLKPPKKHIAIAPRTTEVRNPPNQSRKPPTTNFQIDQAKISQPTVLLTAIRIPQQGNGQHQHQQQQQQQQQLNATAQQQQAKNGSSSNKVGSMFQIPVMPNLVQIPNILATSNGTNLVVNNGQLARMGNGAQYFLNGTVLKLQQIANGHTGNGSSANGVLTMDTSALQGNILVKSPTSIAQGMPLAAASSTASKGTLAIQQPIVTQSSINGNGGCHQTFLGGQRISTQQVLMATASGWYVVNQATDSVSNSIPHPALSTMVCKARTVTSLAGAINPPVPPLVTLSNKHEQLPISGTKFLNSCKLATNLSVEIKDNNSITACTESDKLLSVDVAFTKLKNDPSENNFHLKIPSIVEPPASLTLLTPKETIIATIPCLPSPKSLILEQIQRKTSPSVFTNKLNSIYENLKIECSTTTIAAAAASIVKSEPCALLPIILKTPPTINTNDGQHDLSLLPKCAISPILSQPKTIRFPVPSGCEAGYRFGPKGTKRHDGVCYWDKCSAKYDTSSKLLDHLQTQHVNTQTGPFSCLWSGCKVRGRESCSRRWLERHVLSHGGTKPFKCIVDGCGLRFGSQLALQKHVNGHFTTIETKDNPNKRTSDPPVPKLLRKNGKKLRYRRQPFSARMFDYFDSGIMEGLQHRLMVTGTLASGIKGSVTFQGRTIARRKTLVGATELFVKWSPNEIIPDEWIAETKTVLTKTVTIQSMRCHERFALQKYLSAANLNSDISINTISKTQLFPSIATTMSSLFSSSSSCTTSSSSISENGSSETKTVGRKQTRKPPKRNQIQPS